MQVSLWKSEVVIREVWGRGNNEIGKAAMGQGWDRAGNRREDCKFSAYNHDLTCRSPSQDSGKTKGAGCPE